MIWDEENRLSAVSINGDEYAYTYDHSGERAVKSSSTNDQLFVNGKFMGSVQHGEDFTAYISPMMTFAKEKFTKHYYVGSERVSSRIGSGVFANKFDLATNPTITAGNVNYIRRMNDLNNQSSKELAKKYNLPPGPATNKGVYEKLLLEGKLKATADSNYIAPKTTTYDIPRGWPKYPVFPDSGDVPGPPIQFEELKPDSVKAGYTFTDPNMIGEVDEYFYHGDHLSSVVLVTDRKAQIVQQFVYMPYGELLVDNSTVDLSFRFSAKETDKETGLAYFGARYYDNSAAMWLGVDPLWEKNIGASPYNYCYNNPVVMIDPDGRNSYLLIWFSGNGETGHAGIAIDNYTKVPNLNNRGEQILDNNGNPTYRLEKNGTISYFDLWPQNDIEKNDYQSDVNAHYGNTTIKNKQDLISKDPIESNEYSEGKPADGVIKIKTNPSQDIKMLEYAQKTANSNKKYNACYFNCSTFSQSVIQNIYPHLDAKQHIDIPIYLKLLYKDADVVAPNDLYNATLKLPGTIILKRPDKKESKPYLEYYGK